MLDDLQIHYFFNNMSFPRFSPINFQLKKAQKAQIIAKIVHIQVVQKSFSLYLYHRIFS